MSEDIKPQQEEVASIADFSDGKKFLLGSAGTIAGIIIDAGMMHHNGVGGLIFGTIAGATTALGYPVIRPMVDSVCHEFNLLVEKRQALVRARDEQQQLSPEAIDETQVDGKKFMMPDVPPIVLKEDDDMAFSFDGEDDLPSPRGSSDLFRFSDVLRDGFVPSLEKMFLCRTAVGQDLYCAVKEPYHVALGGNTGGGKSSIMRMLMVQLCKVGVRVLLLNPHYTRYDLENNEDWTPFEPYLVHPPMECRKYEVIEHYLKTAAKDLIPKRLDKRANSQPVGKPYFIVIDELPSIVREIEDAPDYMRIILEEGRKVGVFLIAAAQDFLVKTISPKAGGGSIRECYRTAYYVGGDPTTGKTLLDMQPSLIPEDELGKGVVMFRGVASKKATQVFVPYVDNESLYLLLGPSTYKPLPVASTPEQELERPAVASEQNDVSHLRLISREVVEENYHSQETERLSEAPVATGRFSKSLSPELQRAYDAYQQGNVKCRELGIALGINKDKAAALIRQLKDHRLIAG